jgi:hypothetical protein
VAFSVFFGAALFMGLARLSRRRHPGLHTADGVAARSVPAAQRVADGVHETVDHI